MTVETELKRVWDQLRGKFGSYRSSLQSVRVKDLRGIGDLTLNFRYPVSVIAGTQGCGKSSVLFSLACAYKVPSAGVKDYVPSTFFPAFKAKITTIEHHDELEKIRITYNYNQDNDLFSMSWAKGKNWNRSFAGRKSVSQPARDVYLRTLANLANPSEIRSVLQMGRLALETEDIDPALIQFAQRVLPFKYTRLLKIQSDRKKSLFFAYRQFDNNDKDVSYSEFHMSGGERAVLQLSAEISQRRGALILIDEVEAALHPHTQQLLMLELQRLALRNELQIVVTTHSPAILDTVPPEARIFLDRKDNHTVVTAAYRDVVQDALYGRAFDKLSILCEDEIALSFLRGVFDYINPIDNINPNNIKIGRDTGKDEFAGHVRALEKFGEVSDFIFVLDGDAVSSIDIIKASSPRPLSIILLPGKTGPEEWCIKQIRENYQDYSSQFGVDNSSLIKLVSETDMLYDSATVRQSEKHKYMIDDIARGLGRDVLDVVRTIARTESYKERGDIVHCVNELREAVGRWRSRV